MEFTVRKGKTYQATLKLGTFESWASNERVAEELANYGFTDVEVTGQSYVRYATATWPKGDVTAKLPATITEVVELEDEPDSEGSSQDA
jgi:hypothetical protein